MALRSISLPSRLNSTPLKVEQDINKLKALEQEPLSISSLKTRLLALAELYVSFSDFIRIPSTQQALFSHDQEYLVQETLDCSVVLINTCSSARDIVSSLKDHVRDLQSALRRSSCVEICSSAYLGFRKKSKKEVSKCIKELKQIVKSNSTNELTRVFDDLLIVSVFRDVFCVTISTLESLLLLLSVDSMKSKRWSLIARLMTKQVTGSSSLGEVAIVDVAVLSIQCSKEVDSDTRKTVQRRLRVLDCGSESLESALDRVFRCLVQNRVSLLNILTHLSN